MNNFIKYMLICLLTVVITILLTRSCSGPEVKKDNIRVNLDSIYNVLASKTDSIKTRVDTLKQVKVVYKTKYSTIYDTIYKQTPDTCKPYLIALNNSHLALDSINDAIISRQDSIILNQALMLVNRNQLIGYQDSIIIKLNKKLKRRFWLGYAASKTEDATLLGVFSVIK